MYMNVKCNALPVEDDVIRSDFSRGAADVADSVVDVTGVVVVSNTVVVGQVALYDRPVGSNTTIFRTLEVHDHRYRL